MNAKKSGRSRTASLGPGNRKSQSSDRINRDSQKPAALVVTARRNKPVTGCKLPAAGVWFQSLLESIASFAAGDLNRLLTNHSTDPHVLRVRLKKLAALIRLGESELSPASFAELRQQIRSARDVLSGMRDAAVAGKVYMRQRQKSAKATPKVQQLFVAAGTEMTAARQALAKIDWSGLTWEKVAQAHAATYGRWRKARKRCVADAKIEEFHRWRRRTKDLYYQMLALRSVVGVKPVRKLKKLGKHLGRLQDCQVLLQHKANKSVPTAQRRKLLQKSAACRQRAILTGELCDRGPGRKFYEKLRHTLEIS